MFPTVWQHILGAAIALLAGALYVRILVWASRSNRRFFRVLLFFVCAIIAVNTIADYIVITHISIGPTSTFGAIFLSLFHSAELFLFQTHFFDNGYQEYFFASGNNGAGGDIGMLYIFVVLFLLAIISSMALIIRAFSRQRAGRSWLHDNRANTGSTHIFFLGGKAAMLVARSIRADSSRDGQRIVFVGYPDPYQNYVDLSIWEKILRVFRTRKENDKGPFDSVVYSSIPLNQTSGKDICTQMGLPDLDAFLNDGSCKVYLLTDDENDNLHCADILSGVGCQATIYCQASHEGLNRMYEEMISTKEKSKIVLVDSSLLAVRSLMTGGHNDLLPVKFVESSGEGWVRSPFNSMVLGFGELGHEALGFLYEYGAFIGENFRRSPFTCTVVDRRMDSMREAYLKDYPGMTVEAGVFLLQEEIGSDAFWADMKDRISTLNYIVISLGDPRLNLSIAIEIVRLAFQVLGRHPDHFVVLPAMGEPTSLDRETICHFNGMDQYLGLIHTFGALEDVWTIENITSESLEVKARLFAKAYNIASGKTEEEANEKWIQRENNIHGSNIRDVLNGLRAKSQDYANCFHMETKMALVDEDFKARRKEIAALIPPNYKVEPVHYKGEDKHIEKVLHYLAVLEHIRWEASHVAIGYKPGEPGEATDVIKKTHNCIRDYDKLDGGTQHYDYLVLKTTLELYDDTK